LFTGLIREIGVIEQVRPKSGGAELQVRCEKLMPSLHRGDSIAVDGACLTVTAVSAKGFCADVVAETWSRTIIRWYRRGTKVNLEPALRVGEPLGGHLVLGHVDGVADVVEVQPEGDGKTIWVRPPSSLSRYIAEKGSVALNGVSLTVAAIEGETFSVALVPFTLRETNLGDLVPGSRANLEVDVLARYVERLLGRKVGEEGITLSRLEELGFTARSSSDYRGSPAEL
jgi:riboflavin synthase